MANEKKGYLYSKLSGFNIYDAGPQNLDDIVTSGHLKITDVRAKGEKNILAAMIYKSDEPISDEKAAWFAEIIQNPVSSIFFEWPIDLIEIERSDEFVCCLVYKNVNYNHLKPIKALLYQPSMSRVLDWRDPFMITVCRSFLTVMANLHSNGYIYNDFNINNILYNSDTGEVYFKFTHKLRKSESKTRYDIVECLDISPEFAPPFVYKPDVYDGFMSKETDCYQIATLLFRLMIGRLPYEGRDLMNYGTVFDPEFDTDENAHKYYFQQYHQYPHFIFDENDETNSLSSTSDNDMPRERWNALSDDVQKMFREALCQFAAEHPAAKSFTPEEWLKAVSNLESANK